MALNDNDKKTAEILAAQGETPERIAAYLKVDVKELGAKKRASKAADATQVVKEGRAAKGDLEQAFRESLEKEEQ